MRQTTALEIGLCLVMFLAMLSLWSNTDRLSCASTSYGGVAGYTVLSSPADSGFPPPAESPYVLVADAFVDPPVIPVIAPVRATVLAVTVPQPFVSQYYPDIPVPPSEA